MSTVKQLYFLQEADLSLDRVKASIVAVENELEARLSLGQIEESLAQGKIQLQEIQREHRDLQLSAESLRERSSHLDTQLYGGDIDNPRELEMLQLEAGNVQHQLERQDVGLLEFSLQAEDVRTRIGALEGQLTETKTAWEERQVELWRQLEELTDQRETLEKDRARLAAEVDSFELTRYEGLRKSKGGQPVAKAGNGLCQACRMALPSQHQQRLRAGQTVLCDSCGRLLFPS